MTDNTRAADTPPSPNPAPGAGQPAAPNARPLTPAAERALAEAAMRRQAEGERKLVPEVGGRQGPDPVRYGDWEKGGIVSDF